VTDSAEAAAIRTALRNLEGFEVPEDEFREWLSTQRGHSLRGFDGLTVFSGAGPDAEDFIRSRCVTEFAMHLNTTEPFRQGNVFHYFHNREGVSNDPSILHGEQSLDSPSGGSAHEIAFGDIVFLYLTTFAGGKEPELPRIVGRLADRGALIFISQLGLTNPNAPDTFTPWFRQFDYVPVKPGLLDGLFRPILPALDY
jgi:hypothetical protein